ncbi:4a-hydroxytetrahydrobiopterin dehydratase [bacterium]|nr:4a-hydroxytetrahydrobiopterin dehydratase [bacterium]
MDKTKLKVFTDSEIVAELSRRSLGGWYLEDGWIRRKYTTAGWQTTLMLVNAIGFICEAAWHHADLSVTWGKVWVKLKTHDHGGITAKDFELASKIESTVLWKPETGHSLEGNPNKFINGSNQ